MLTNFFRCIILYVVLLFVMRLMGKRQLSELQPFEFIITLMIAELACIPMSEISIPILYGIVPILTLFLLHYVVTKLASKSLKFNRFINGKPLVLMDQKGIDHSMLEKLDMNVLDVMTALRSSGYFVPQDVAYVIIETNGKISVMPKADKAPMTPFTSNVKVEEAALQFPVVCEGDYVDENLQRLGIDRQKIQQFLESKQLTAKSVLLVTATEDGSLYVQPTEGDAFESELPQ